MALVTSSAMPLLALEAVVIDTETTGLDARNARIVEIALVPLVGGRLDTAAACRRLVRPDVAIPTRATRIHGIDAATVTGAPTFAEVWPELAAMLGERAVIGHALNFDLSVLEGECRRAHLQWARPRALDVRLLAELAVPNLHDYSLESLAAYFKFEIAGRHSALGDAIGAGCAFVALLPGLRNVGVRTLGEAERSCAALSEARETQHSATWASTTSRPWNPDPEPERIDSYPYRHHVRDLMSAPPRFTAPDTSVALVLGEMSKQRVSSLFVHSASGGLPPTAAETGIVTERDVMRALAKHGAKVLLEPVGGIATYPLSTVPADAYAFLAIARMNRLRIRHLGVTDEAGRVTGALSARDLLRLRAERSLALGDEIAEATELSKLACAWAKLPHIVTALFAERLSGMEIAALISHQVRALTQRAVVLAEERMRKDGHGGPPCSYAFTVLGSAGRGESLLAMDQDNALVFAAGAEGMAEDRWFEAFASHVADTLHAVGIPYCKGGVMAKNARWRGSLSAWEQRIREWIEKSRPQDLLSVDIFFDMLFVHGDASLADTVWRTGFDAARGQHAFAKLLVETAGWTEAGLGMFGGFRTVRDRIDLKKTGLFGLVTTARALAICHHVVERSTRARLAGIKALGRGGEDIDALLAAQQVFHNLLVAQQIRDISNGIPPSNAVEVKGLSRQERERLRGALSSVGHLEAMTRDLLFGK
jgi:CBS domain-containing protein